jgi:heme exporter protein A
MKAHRNKGGIVIAATHQELGLEDAQRLAMKGFEYGEMMY